MRYIGESTEETNTYTIPAYTLFDMMVAYDPGPFRLQLNVNNIGDERYVAACYARGDCYYGLGRTVLGTATYRFLDHWLRYDSRWSCAGLQRPSIVHV